MLKQGGGINNTNNMVFCSLSKIIDKDLICLLGLVSLK